MTAAAPPTGLTAMPSPEPLPAPVSGQRHEIASSVGRLSYYDLPPLKWSSLKYIFRMEDEIDGKEEAYSGRDCCEASAGRCADGARPAGSGCGSSDRRDGS